MFNQEKVRLLPLLQPVTTGGDATERAGAIVFTAIDLVTNAETRTKAK